MKYLTLFFISLFTLGCYQETLLSEESYDDSETSSEEEADVQAPNSDSPYRMGCGEASFHRDALGHSYTLPVLCEEHYIDKGRPVDKDFTSGDEYLNQIQLMHQSFSDFEG